MPSTKLPRERAQSFLTSDHIERIVEAYKRFRSDEEFAAVVTLADLRANLANLSIPLYVRRTSKGGGLHLPEAVAAWRESSASLRTAADSLQGLRFAQVTQ